MSTDMILFRNGPARGFSAGWDGPWPPPETFMVAVGRESGYISVVSPNASEDDLAAARAVADFHTYTRRNASTLPDDFQSPHVFRGADYVLEQA